MKHPLRRRWLFFGFQATRVLMRWCPLPVAQALGTILGYGLYACSGRYRRLIWSQLRFAFGPALSDKVCRRIARGLCANLGRTLLEWFVLDRLRPQQLRRLVEVHGVHHLERALERGRGVIALSAHFGNWELIPTTLAAMGFKGGVLARRLRYPEYERFLTEMRAKKGVATIPRGSVKDAARVLRDNQIVGMMPDQDIDSLEGVFVDFFGHQAYTPVGPAALSMMTGAAVVPMFIIRVGRKFRITIEEALPPVRTGEKMQDLVTLTQLWSRVVESYIRCYPDHWVWMHRRWKTTPSSLAQRRAAPPEAMPAGVGHREEAA